VLWSHKVVSVRTDRSRAVNEGSIPGVTRSFDDWATSYDSVIVQAPIFSNSPARALDSTATAYTATPFFNDDPTIMQAPIFSNSPARALDSTAAASTDASFSRLSVSYPQTNSQGNIQSMGTFSSLGIP